jgi:hypothetical protein
VIDVAGRADDDSLHDRSWDSGERQRNNLNLPGETGVVIRFMIRRLVDLELADCG